jgi:hypothetical protein
MGNWRNYNATEQGRMSALLYIVKLLQLGSQHAGNNFRKEYMCLLSFRNY